jgi:hypothetical protein
MIVTTQKPLDEIMNSISPFKNILIAGCDGCTQPPRGIKEAETLRQLLELAGTMKNKTFQFKTVTIAKQCDSYLLKTSFEPLIQGQDAVLSLACGIGVGEIAKVFPSTMVFPAQNTHFMGAEEREAGYIEERCGGCGNCYLAMTGGICPVVRCTKGLLTGACGGSKNGKCELSPDKDCGWILIYERLKALGKLELLKEKRDFRDYRLSAWRVNT